MIEQIYTYFTIETLYMWINLGVIPFWLILIFFPQSYLCRFFVTSIFPFVLLSGTYVFILYKSLLIGYDFDGNFNLYLGLNELSKLFEDAGADFATEVRKMHYGDIEPENIYGHSSNEERESLADEGIDVVTLPWLPPEH